MTDSRDLTARAADAAERFQAPVVRQSETLLAQVLAAAKDPNVDAVKMETLARLVNSQQDREREQEYNRDKNAAIMAMPVITKDGKIVIRKTGEAERLQGRFARWEDIDRVIRPILRRFNLALSFDIAERQGGGLTVTPILSHANGHTERGGAFPVPAEDSGAKNKAQAMGSSAAYGKRYAGCGMLNIVTEGVDDDGRGGVKDVTLPFEREQLVLEEAGQAFDNGTYIAWFSQQSPKDRAWLIQSGKHVEFGGQPLLTGRADAPGSQRREEERPPAPSASPAREPDQPPPPPPPTPPAEEPPAANVTGGSGQTKRTPEQMVADFEKRLDEVKESRGIIDLQAEPKILQWMGSLEERYPDLHRRVVDYAAAKYAELSAAEKDKARSTEKLI
jgi:hypothetical protein